MLNNLSIDNKHKINSIDKVIYELEENYFNMEIDDFYSKIDKINKDLEKLKIKTKNKKENQYYDKEKLILSIENLSKRISNLKKIFSIQKSQLKNESVKTNFDENLYQTETKLLFDNNHNDYNKINNQEQENTNKISSPNEQFEEIILNIDEVPKNKIKNKKSYTKLIGFILIIIILVVIITLSILL